MEIYDGSGDKKALPTKHTIAVVSAGRIVAHRKKDHMTMRRNGREDWSLFYCEAGCLYIDGQVLQAGQMWLYPPRVPQTYIAYSKDRVVYRYLHFTGSDVVHLLDSIAVSTLVPICAENKSILKCLDNIQIAMQDGSPLSNLTAEYNTLYLLSRVANGKRRVSQAGMIKRVIDDMEYSITRKYDATYYAGLLNLSVSRFNHLFKEQTGVAPYSYMLRLRMDSAVVLLEQTNMKIKDISEQCGFENPLYFTQVFKRQYGMTPSQFCKLNCAIIYEA